LLENNVGLVHTRLSIIDLAGGDQPLHLPANSTSLIANGEIYNFPAIRNEFEKRKYGFTTNSDCEVILPLYAEYGEACVEHLRGMFAFCLYDRNADRLFFARDRMGEKPLYYYMDENLLVFSSELHSLIASGLVPKSLNHRAIGRYFRYQYVPEPETPFRKVYKLAAASHMTLDMAQWRIETAKYWDAFAVDPIESDPVKSIRSAVEDAVATSLISDVPIGLSLSGGIDSSLLACLMRKNTDRPLNAISIGYVDADIVDEREEARALAKALGMDFHDVEIEDHEMISRFPEMVTKRDDLIGDISGFNYFKIMEHAREQGIPVMLQGHGVDELCWGYPWVRILLP
jgi:asparagine synthase (glutamine-hydrolysing)